MTIPAPQQCPVGKTYYYQPPMSLGGFSTPSPTYFDDSDPSKIIRLLPGTLVPYIERINTPIALDNSVGSKIVMGFNYMQSSYASFPITWACQLRTPTTVYMQTGWRSSGSPLVGQVAVAPKSGVWSYTPSRTALTGVINQLTFTFEVIATDTIRATARVVNTGLGIDDVVTVTDTTFPSYLNLRIESFFRQAGDLWELVEYYQVGDALPLTCLGPDTPGFRYRRCSVRVYRPLPIGVTTLGWPEDMDVITMTTLGYNKYNIGDLMPMF